MTAGGSRRVLIAVAALMAAGALILTFDDTLAGALEPLALRFDGDGIVDDENRGALIRMLQLAGGGLLIGALGVGFWVGAWMAAAVRLSPLSIPAVPALAPVTALDLAVVGAAMAALAGLSVPHLGRGLEFDEIVTVRQVVQAPTWADVFRTAVVFNNHVPFSALSRLSGLLFGASEIVYRLPALLLGLGALPVTWAMARRWHGPAVAGASAWLLAVAPLAVQYSASARGYTGLLLFGTLSCHLFLLTLERPTRWRVTGNACALAVGTWFHLYGVFIAGGQALTLVWLLWTRPARVSSDGCRGNLLALAAAGPLIALLYAPIAPRLLLEMARRGRGVFQPDFPLATALELSGGSAIVLVVALWGLWRIARGGSPGAMLPVFTAGTAIGGAWLLNPLDLYTRFFMFLLPFAAIAVAVALVGSRGLSRPWRLASWAAVVAITVSWGVRSTTYVPEEGYRAAARALAGAPDGAVVVGIGVGSGLVDYYLGRTVPVANTLEEYRDLTRRARQVVVVHRRGMHDTDVHPVKRYLDAQGYVPARHANLSVYVVTP